MLQFALLAAIGIALAGSSRAVATESFSVTGSAGPATIFTIHLPTGWKLAASEENRAVRDRFVFESPRAQGPYVFCRVERCDARTLDERLRAAGEDEHRRFLSGGKVETAYFDASRSVAWKRAATKGEYVIVSATYFGESLLHFKFFTPAREFREFERAVRRIGENIEVHGGSSDAGADLTEAQLEALFEFADDSPVHKYFWMAAVGLFVAGLFLVERTIRLRRHRAHLAELDRQRDERLANDRFAGPGKFHGDAETYTKKLGKR